MPNQYTSLLMPTRFLVNIGRNGASPDRHAEYGNCWDWSAYRFPDGYGGFYFGGRTQVAHRVAWVIATGQPIPPGMKVCHTCDIRHCVRHDDIGIYEVGGVIYERRGHLWLGTTAANQADMAAKGRSMTGERNARYTHPETTARGDRSGARLHPETRARGSRHGNTILTEAMVLDIRARYAAGGITLQTLADEVGTGKSTMYRIIHRHYWRHI